MSTQWASSWPELAEEADRRYLFEYLERRFGIPQTHFADYLLLRKKKSWSLMRDAESIPSVSRLKVSQAGLRAFQRVGDFVKPTTRFIQSFGSYATRAKVSIDLIQLRTLLSGGKIQVDLTLDNGYVILEIGEGRVLGLGLYIDGVVSSQLPGKEIRGLMLSDVG
jgi:NOL1/NOP2/fmu family ribosome biogenesis protein